MLEFIKRYKYITSIVIYRGRIVFNILRIRVGIIIIVRF